jgi:hypothetical protein
VENVTGITYLSDQMDDLVEAIDGLEPRDAAKAVGAVLLEARLNELADEDRYNRLADGVTETLDRFGSKKKKAEAKSKGSQRKSANGNGSEATEEPAEKPKRGQTSPEAVSALQELKANAAKRKATA